MAGLKIFFLLSRFGLMQFEKLRYAPAAQVARGGNDGVSFRKAFAVPLSSSKGS